MKIAPALRILVMTAKGSFVTISRCSDAMALAVSTASSMEEATKIYPKFSRDFSRISFLESCSTNRSTSAETFSASFLLVVTRMAEASSSCSAWDKRSAATNLGLAVSSAKIRISLGPAMLSMLTWPYTAFFARATKILPGPTILLTLGMDWVPKARAATAWAPPTLYTSVAPARQAAVRVTGFTFPSFPGGVTMTIRSTPATSAGIMFISTEEG